MAIKHSSAKAALLEIEAKRPAWLGIRVSAIIETLLYLAAALAVDYFLLDGTRFRSIRPHPFWPIVILMSMQYGTSAGLFAAALSTLALLAANFPEQTINQDSYDYLFVILREPVLWFVATIVLGELRMRQLGERQSLREDLAASLRRESSLESAYARVRKIKDSLEARVAGQLRTAVTMYQVARKLEKVDPSEVLLGVSEVVNVVMNPKKFSLYLLERDSLEICVGEGWEPADTTSRVFKSSSSLFREVIGRQRVLCVANPEDEVILAKEGLLAGPLLDRETGSAIGMLKIEELGFLDLHFSNVQTFRVLCDWIADAYVNAERYQTMETENADNARASAARAGGGGQG